MSKFQASGSVEVFWNGALLGTTGERPMTQVEWHEAQHPQQMVEFIKRHLPSAVLTGALLQFAADADALCRCDTYRGNLSSNNYDGWGQCGDQAGCACTTAARAAIMRDIFGNPYAHCIADCQALLPLSCKTHDCPSVKREGTRLCPKGRDYFGKYIATNADVQALAQAAAGGDSCHAVLWDALEDAGCDNAIIREHLRPTVVPFNNGGQAYWYTAAEPGFHHLTPGRAATWHSKACWVVRLILGERIVL